MSDYTLAGEIVLRDLFSTSLDKLETGARSAEGSVNKLGNEVDEIGNDPGIVALNARIEKLQSEAAAAAVSLDRMGKELENTPALAKVKQLEAAIASIKAKAASGIPLTIGDVDQFHRLNGELTSLQTGLTGAQGKAMGLKGAFSGLTSVMGGLGLAFGAQQIVSGTIALIKQGASVEELRGAYEALTQSANINGDALLASIQKASFGTISNVDAMLIANRALLSEQDQVLTKMPQIVTYAASVADALGKSTLEVTQGIVEALATGQVRGLKEFGIVIAQKDALAAAEALGQETDAMKRQEIVAQLTTAAIEEMAKKQLILGENSMSNADKIDASTAAWQDWKTAMGEALLLMGSPLLTRATEGMTLGKEIDAQREDIKAFAKEMAKLGQLDKGDFLKTLAKAQVLEQLGMYREALAVLQEYRAELAATFGELGQLPSSARDTGMILVQTAEGVREFGKAAQEIRTVDLAGQLQAANQASRGAVGGFVSLAGAVWQVAAAAHGLATTDFVGNLGTQSISGMENQLLGLVGILDSRTISAWREKYIAGEQKLMTQSAGVDKWGLKLQQKQYDDYWGGVIDSTRKAHDTIETNQKQHIERMFNDASSLKSAIEGALQGDMTVTSLDIQLSSEGQYKDKVNEAARQLAAVAQRGFSELKVHPDWASALKIPPEVLSGSEAQLKDWAGRTAGAVNANLRPDLINWDTFIANFKQGLEDNAAKSLTIDIAVGKLKEAGVLDADTKALRDQIAASLGLKVPSLTIDAMFAANEGAGAGLVKQVTGPLGYIEVPAIVKYMTDTGGTPGSGSQLALPTGATVPMPAMPAGVDLVGTDMATTLLGGFDATMSTTDVGSVTLGYWSASFYAQSVGYGNIGSSMGHTVSAAFIEAMRLDLGGMRDIVAGWLAPAVLGQLQRSLRGKGAIE